MSQPYWSWGSDFPKCDAPSVVLRVCKDLDELNSVVQQLRNETRWKSRDAGAERNKTKDAGEERNKTEDEDAGEESQKTEDAGEKSDKTEDGGVAESREQCVQNGKEEVQYTPPDINWDDLSVLGSGKRGVEERVRFLALQWICREIPNISEDTIADHLRSVPHDSLLEVAKFCWEWGEEENSHVQLCEEDGTEGSHNFFVRLLTKDGWLDDLVSVMMHNSCATMQKCAALDYKQMKAYVGNEDRQHSKGLLGMVKGEGPKLANSWSSVNCSEIRAYDSKVDLCITQAIQRAVQPVAKMLPRLLKESGYIGEGLLLKIEWPVIRVMDAPQQVGGGDCGMYILKYCKFLTSNVDLANHDVMPFYRLKLTVQFLQGYW
ncbi:unnamed protein product [Prunus armeniaca]|uniref:Ubiquitin-like protease family profile domain-containing protein n=1 Tax=Prunus armeniaca TaxID=36596 RepID=A0A6J5W2G9_PRUAR|nr:unnamed protein product [Prunus armeniaca]CAB4294192.1 unnamed protein product [Prunus armeniaca]